MKKYLLIMALVFGALLTSCGGNKATDEHIDEQIDEVVEDTSLKPPFTVVASIYSSGFHDERKVRTYTYEIKESGMYTLTMDEEVADENDNVWIRVDEDYPKTKEGRWTTLYRTVGEGEQKVYDIHLPNGEHDYIPEVGDYMWLYSAGNMFDGYATWEQCANFNTTHASKIAEYTTSAGTTTLISQEDRYPVVEVKEVNDVFNGKTFMNDKGKTLSFNDGKVTCFDPETNETQTGKYGFSGDHLTLTPLNRIASVSNGGFYFVTGMGPENCYYRKDLCDGSKNENFLEGKTYKCHVEDTPDAFWVLTFKDGIATLSRTDNDLTQTGRYKYSNRNVSIEGIGSAPVGQYYNTLFLLGRYGTFTLSE